jgi:DNA helicase-2/ATP-dependent DNA helicase PcrA
MKMDAMNRKPKVADVYKLYALRCKKADAMDFDDLLLNTNILFRDFPEVLRKYQDSFRYILVDEYQDTNYAQYLIVKKLAARHKNVCVVGDDAQSIYSFRGAKIENILNFRNDYPGYNIFKLEQNYRSTQNIVNAANSLILKNKDQIKKKVWSANDTGTRIQVLEASTDNEEGFLVAGAINDTIYREQVQYRDIAILYRTNAQSRIFEEALRKKNIPYKVYGSLSFYQRKEIKDLLSYFRLTVNPNDTEALKRVINYPARGIGNTTQSRIEEYANANDVSMWEIVTQPDAYPIELNAGVKKKLVGFSNLINNFRSLLTETDAYELANHIANASGILEDLHFKNTPENLSKYENIQELLNSIKEFTDNRTEDEVKTLDYYLENVALLTDADNEKEEDINKVSIMTIHASKGLEFDYVFIAGMEEELFPSRMSITLPQDLEEERRLFYVAITRARKQATLSYAFTRYKWGTLSHSNPSRFIEEIDGAYIDLPDKEERNNLQRFQRKSYGVAGGADRSADLFSRKGTPSQVNPDIQRKLTRLKTASAATANNNDVPFEASDPNTLKEGMVVEHQRFGTGTITALEGNSPNMKATVMFNGAGQKQLLLKFAKLKIVK